MAKLGKKGLLSGLVGNLVFRNLDGVQIVQSQPDGVRQTRATKESSSEFSRCSQWAKQLRMGMRSFLMDQTDNYMYRRFTGAFYTALQQNTTMLKGERTPLNADMSGLVGFDFNQHSPFANSFLPKIEVTVENGTCIKIVVPSFEPKSEIVFPKRQYLCELMVYVYTTSFTFNEPLHDAFFVLPIVASNEVQPETIWITPALPEGRMVLVTAKMLFYSSTKFTDKIYSNSASFNPCGVVGCCRL